MNREEILNKSREEHETRDPVEMDMMKNATNISYKIGLVMCCILSVCSIIVNQKVLFSLWIVYFTMMASREIAYYTQRRDRASIIMGFVFTLLTVFFLVLFFIGGR